MPHSCAKLPSHHRLKIVTETGFDGRLLKHARHVFSGMFFLRSSNRGEGSIGNAGCDSVRNDFYAIRQGARTRSLRLQLLQFPAKIAPGFDKACLAYFVAKIMKILCPLFPPKYACGDDGPLGILLDARHTFRHNFASLATLDTFWQPGLKMPHALGSCVQFSGRQTHVRYTNSLGNF